MNFRLRKRVDRKRRTPRANRTKAIGFRPSTVNRDAARSEVKVVVRQFKRDAFDEASGSLLDRRIRAWSRQWLADLAQGFTRYKGRAQEKRDRLAAALPKLEMRLSQAERACAERDHEREAARARMFGSAATGPDTDPTSLAGRAGHGLLFALALVFAIAADVAAFVNVLELAMPDQPWPIVLVLVLGFTAVVLALAHGAGALLRDRRAGVAWIPAFAVPLCVSVWGALGLLAAWVRLTFGAVPGDFGSFSIGAASPLQSKAAFAVPAALIFLALYVGSGVVAATGAYLANNRMQAAFRHAARAHDRAMAQVVVCTDALERQKSKCAAQTATVEIAEETFRHERESLIAFSEELQEYARQLVAIKAQDPAITDAFIQRLELLPSPDPDPDSESAPDSDHRESA